MTSKRRLERDLEQLKETSTDERIVILRKDGDDGCRDTITGETWSNPEDVPEDVTLINITDAGGSLV